MISSAMFYRTEQTVDRPVIAKIGPFTFSLQELFVSVVSAAIVFPVTIFVTIMFRSSNKSDHNKIIPSDNYSEIVEEELDDISVLLGNLDTNLRTYPSSKAPVSHKARHAERSNAKNICNNIKLFMAWLIANLAIFAAAFFVILYSMEWGADVSNSWLLSYILSFITSAFFVDPGKVNSLFLYNRVITFNLAC